MLPLLACTGAPAATPAPFHLVEAGKVEHPTAIVEPAAGPGGLHVAEQEGRIWRIRDGERTELLDISERLVAGGEKGLLGLAFSPAYPGDPRVFVNYTYREGPRLRTRIASFRVDPDGARIDPESEVEVLSFEQPYTNHNSGSLAFGPDGFLYAGVGDGGSGGDPERHAQNLGDWLGSILRIDVSKPPYAVPPDNPFVGRPGAKPEIWAYGVRNPWGMHFDGDTLWFADVGQDRWEEINRGVRGADYGWNILEGTRCYAARTCDADGRVPPVAEYGHDLGQSVTGGLVYRGPSIPALDGRYVFADFASRRLWTLPPEGGPATLLTAIEASPSTFGRDRAGNLYIGGYGGTIWRVAP